MKLPDPTVPLAVMGVVGLVLCVRAATRPITQLETEVQASSEVPVSQLDSTVVMSWAGRAPFRRMRRPTEVAFDALKLDVAAVQAPAPKAPRPQLVLRGVIMGGTPAALIEGLPGVDGMRAMRQGERIGSLEVRSITRGLVRITGEDTTWNLAIREAGK